MSSKSISSKGARELYTEEIKNTRGSARTFSKNKRQRKNKQGIRELTLIQGIVPHGAMKCNI